MNTKMSLGTMAVVSLLALGACEKDSGLSKKQSGKLRSNESSMLANLPGGNVGMFGGNYMKLQGFFQNSAMAKVMGQMEAMAPGMTAWTECFLTGDASKLQMLGVVSYQGDEAKMTYVMRGFGIPQIEACAKKASFPTTVDADGKYVAIEMPGALGAQPLGYLVLADGSLLSSQAMPFPPTGAVVPSTRADLEAVVASAAKANANTDTVLIDEASHIDRDRAVWFVANLNGTPAGDKIGLLRGWFDIDGGLATDLSIQITDKATAAEIAKGIPEMKSQADRLGKDVAELIRGLRYERNGDRFRFGLKITNAQMEKLMAGMGGMLGGGF
jgi:hypothetical protein